MITSLRTRPPRVVRRLPVLLAVVACVVGCGAKPRAAPTRPIADAPPAGVVPETIAAGSSADSVHLVGDATRGADDVHYDVWVGRNEGTGRFTINGGKLDAIRTGSKVYIRGDRRFWHEALGQDSKYPLSDWAEASAKNPIVGGAVALLDLRSALGTVLPTGTRMIEVGPAVRNGQRALEFNEANGGGEDLYVARDGPPYPLAYADSAGVEDGSAFTFSDWNAPLHVTAPKASYTLDD